MSSNGVPKLLTVPDVVRATGLSRWSVYRLIETGSLPAMRIGRTIRISERVLVAWIEEQHAHRPEVENG